MKKTILAATAAAGLFTAFSTGCSMKKDVSYKIIQDRVVELTYSKFNQDEAAAYLAKYDPQMGACSAIKLTLNGKVYVGRDYDFYCSNTPAVIVRNNSGKIRTIGIANSPSSFPEWTNAKDYKIPEKVLAAAPFLCCDVMSEAGIYAETNIRPYESQLACSSTNPGKTRRCTQTFMQTMLSQYSTIDEILSHLDDYDWYDLQKMGFEQSFFLTDKTGYSVIIEFGAGKVHWQESDFNANFFQNQELYAIETVGCGELRVEKERALKPSVKEEKDIYTMMKAGAYDQFYHTDVDLAYAVPEYYDQTGYNKAKYAADPEGAKIATAKVLAEYAAYTWDDRVANHSWESTFINTVNVTDMIIKVHFSEHYNIEFTFGFNK